MLSAETSVRKTHIVLPRTSQVRIILDTVYIDLADARNRHAHQCTHGLVEHLIRGVQVDLCRVHDNPSCPSTWARRWTPSTSSRQSGNGKHRRVLFDDVLLASDFDHHAHHLVRHLVVLCLHVASGVVARPRHVRETSGRT